MSRLGALPTSRAPQAGRIVLWSLVLVLMGASAIGCGPSQPAKDPNGPEGNRLAPVPISNVEFALAVHRLLREGEPSAQRSALLAGVMRQQMTRAAAHFRRGDNERGTAAVVGGLYLLRIGEGRPDMLGPDGSRALAGAIERFSARGDEGRSLALMIMRASLLPAASADRKAIDGHLAALRRWMTDTRTGGDMERLTADMRAAVDRALIEPDEEGLRKAAEAVSRWIDRAVEYNLEFQQTREPPPLQEAQEAFRALQTGGATMATLFLRHGRALAATEKIETTAARRVIPPPLHRLIQRAAEDDTASDWRALADVLARDSYDGEGLLRLDPGLRDAALWGVAVEAYRRDHSSLGVAHVLADLLVHYGMPEVAPLVLTDALGAQPSPVAVSGALAAIGDALEPELEEGTTDNARLIFAASQAILALGDRDEFRGRLDPSPARLRQLMANIEIRAGEVDAARPLLETALKAEPTVWGYTMLGMLERQVGHADVALRHARRAIELPAAKVRIQGTGHRLDGAEAQLLIFEILRERGQRADALAALEEALTTVLTTLGERIPAQVRVRADRMLARVLDGYGDRAGASRAMHRALALATRHRRILGATMLTAIGRALVARDVDAARAALQTGLDTDAEEDDLVYGALWLMLTEKRLGEAPDGKVERVLGGAVHSDTWTGRLARWARGRLSDAALRGAAKSYAQKIEAEFYVAMRGWLTGQAGAEQILRRVAHNPLLDLLEVHLARDVLAKGLTAEIPKRFRIP